MTKDVLVSISGHHIDIMAEPEETPEAMESGRDAIEVVTPASYYCKGANTILFTMKCWREWPER